MNPSTDTRTIAEAPWSQRIVLVTGATGVVGSNLVHHLLQRGAQVVALIRDPDPASALYDSGDFERISLASGRLECFEQVKAVIVERDIDTVFHLGAQALVGAAQRDPIGTFESNVRGTYHILEACRLCADRVQRIIVASSDKAYGECDALPYTETTPLAARNPYDVSKCCADLIAQSYGASFGLPIAIARCGNIFGPGDINWSRLVPGTIRALLQGQRPVIRSDGTLVRDYLYVDDAVRAYLALADWLDQPSARSDPKRAFNFSSNFPLSVLDMTGMIQRACRRPDLDPIIQGRNAGEIRSQHLDCARARVHLHWQSRTDMASALEASVEWYRHYLNRRQPMHDATPIPLHFQTRASA